MKKLTIFNFPVSVGKYHEYLDNIIESAELRNSKYIYVANVHMLVEAYMNRSFLDKVYNAFIITPDGKPITWALKLLHGIKQDRVAGMDILPALLERAEKTRLPVFIYGGTHSLLERAGEYIEEHYPNLLVTGFYSPPFNDPTPEEESQIIEKINNAAPGLVFTVLGCPKQEKWMASMQGRINSVMIGIGGALSVLVGIQKRAPKWMQKASLEWFFRLCLEPRRLFKRYAVTNSFFLYLLGKELIKKTFFRKKFSLN
jgi:N-acetylglucosaminyldiphosphoundecaprenol N-acetyl-beta-D-mannosaminyltransferase